MQVGGWVLCRIKKSNRRVPEERDEDDEKIMGATTGPVEEIQLQESCNGGLHGWNNNVGSMDTNPFDEELLDHFLEKMEKFLDHT